jgi:hydroxyacylglutathione hydrolase
MHIKSFCFNPFAENTYILYEEQGEAWIFDPGCSNPNEERLLQEFIVRNQLKPSRLILTHAHIDHVLGLEYIYKTYGLLAELHQKEEQVLLSAEQIGRMYGVPFVYPGHNKTYLADNQIIKFGNTAIKCIWAPGHSPGSICYLIEDHNMLIGGDVLFDGSIGRTDLPGGDHETLLRSIETRLFTLNDDIKVYPGHEGLTTIGKERKTNPFF